MRLKRYSFKYNNTELVFTDVIHVSPEGNDSTGDGTKEKPYYGVKKAISMLQNDTTAIVMLPGEYNYDSLQFTNLGFYDRINSDGYLYLSDSNYRYYRCPSATINSAVFTSQNYDTTFIGYQNETIVNITFNTQNMVAVCPTYKKLTMYGIVVNIDSKTNVPSAGDVNGNCIIGSYYKTSNLYIYNCVFKYVNNFTNGRKIYHACYQASASYMENCIIDMGYIYNAFAGERHSNFTNYSYRFYNNSYTDVGKMYDIDDENQNSILQLTNCIILNLEAFNSQYSTTTGPVINMINCVHYSAPKMFSVTTTNCIPDNIRLDEDYYPFETTYWKNSGKADIKNPDNNVSNIGVYGGRFCWNKVASDQCEITMKEFNKIVDKDRNMTYEFDIVPPVSSNISKIDNKINNNFIESGTQYKIIFDKLSWKKIDKIDIE